MPPHSGHLYLIDFARHMVDRLYVLVCTLSHEPIPGHLRYEWIRELAPTCEVIHITEEIPEAKRGESGATTIWARAVRDAVSDDITHVFASEQYGWELARHLDAQYVPVDPSRSNIPVSASAIRANPWEKWRFIPPPVRPWFVRHIAVVGDSAYAERTARAMDTVVVHPYRAFWRRTWDTYHGDDKRYPLTQEQVRRGSVSTAIALARRANRVLFHDLEDEDGLSDIPHIDLVVVDEDRIEALRQDRRHHRARGCTESASDGHETSP